MAPMTEVPLVGRIAPIAPMTELPPVGAKSRHDRGPPRGGESRHDRPPPRGGEIAPMTEVHVGANRADRVPSGTRTPTLTVMCTRKSFGTTLNVFTMSSWSDAKL